MSKNDSNSKIAVRQVRFWEIDVLRGIAIILMILYHAIFLIWLMSVVEVDVFAFHWLLVARIASTTFLVLVGVSLALSFQKAQQTSKSLAKWQRQRAIRSLQIVGWGMIVSLFTVWTIPQSPVIFGVLHLIGVGSLFSLPLVPHPRAALIATVVIATISPFLKTNSADSIHLIWLGRIPPNFQSVDYWPLLPWIGLLWFGIFIGHALFREYDRRYVLSRQPSRFEQLLERLGRHSLVLYLIHTPIIITFLWILKIFR